MQVHLQRAERLNLQRIVAGPRFRHPVSVAEQNAFMGMWRSALHVSAGLVIEPQEATRLITNGWAGWLRYSDDGKRLIFLFLMPGDFIVPSLFEPGCCDLVSLTPMRIVDATSLLDEASGAAQSVKIIQESGRYYRLLLVDHLTRLTNGCTTRSVAHLLAEFHARSVRTGMIDDSRFQLPIGQRVLARALGRSTVQVNKVITQFQSSGLLKVGYDWIEVMRPAALYALAGLADRSSTPARCSSAFSATGF